MDHTSVSRGKTTRSPVLEALADDRRRRILSFLSDRASPVGEEDLARHLLATEEGEPLPDVTDAEVQSLRVELAHVQLPTLEDAGLVARDREAGTVTTTDDPVFEDPQFEYIIETEADGWSAVLANLAHRRRRIVLSVLDGRDTETTRADLARAVIANETGEADAETLDDLRTELHHVHLPKLDAAGLVEYDADDGTAAYVGHPALNEEWIDFPRRRTADLDSLTVRTASRR